MKKPLTVGLKSGTDIEVVHGLSAADQVVPKDAGSLAAGQGVEAAAPPTPK